MVTEVVWGEIYVLQMFVARIYLAKPLCLLHQCQGFRVELYVYTPQVYSNKRKLRSIGFEQGQRQLMRALELVMGTFTEWNASSASAYT